MNTHLLIRVPDFPVPNFGTGNFMDTPPVQPVEYLRTTKPPSRRAHAPAQESKSSYQGAFIILPSLVAAGRGHVSRAACLAVSLSSLSLSLGTGRPRCALVLAARPLVLAALPQAAAVHTRRQAEAKEGMLVFEDSRARALLHTVSPCDAYTYAHACKAKNR